MKKKSYYINNEVLLNFKQEQLKKKNQESNIQVFSRSSHILPFFQNHICYIYNGLDFKQVLISNNKLFFKFGEFYFTRKLLNLKKKK